MPSEKKGTDAGLLAALDTPVRKHPGMVCGVSKVLAILDPPVRDKVLSIIQDIRAARESGGKSQYTVRWLANTLTDHGHDISALTVGIHVRKGCRCE